ncbi:SNF2-related protein [Bifidobacterium sp. M3-N-101]|uniref:DEAD/DEAH box helicase family protein n=1 Tax=Bifidobacterium sp. M3-N-101 TaxID=2949653 RepID=UPI00202E08EE|nr:SNF2-related protein [Bifidobacterium sp. M3-N-101]MCM0690978.1 SNF2-related protein [Bifidobacterium sp. M3-N-101]
MWDALDIGSTPIQVLEPGCGTGNFMAGIPDDAHAHVSGVELDPISARIAAALNPDATILNADLADCTIHPGFDLAIGNVPYSGDISLDYRTMDGGTSRLPLHDYFIERSVDALRPGGVAMLLTSRYTLDKRSETMRADLARKAELVGVVRLPSSTFARQAGTEAVTDVLVLRRRERTLDRTPDEAWIHSTPIAVPGYQDVTVNVNQAVAGDMAAHAVGDIRPVIGRFGGDSDVVFQGDAEQVGDRLRELLTTQIAHGRPLTLGGTEPDGRAEITVRPDHVAPFEYSVDQRGVVWYGDGTTVTEIAHGQGDEARRLRGMIRLRDLARELQRLELDPARVDDPLVEDKRAELDRAYDRFAGKFGRLCDRANRRAYSGEESGCHLVMALEETDEKGRFAGKAKCLSQRTISPVPPMPDHADSLDNAQITVTKDSPTETTASGKPKRVKDQKATMAAIEKANAIRDAWNQWVFKDPDRAQRLTALYNRRFNGMRPRHVDGSYLTTPGIAHGVALRPHQKDAVARALRSDEGTLIAHVVGAGKTFEGVALSHEAKRLGKASKPMLVVPNHLVDQWAGDVLRLYPAGRVLVMDKDAQRNPESVRRFWGRVATGDWDAVIVPESRFSQLHVSKERRLRNMRARVDEFAQAVEAAAKARGDKDPTVKRLEAARKSAETAMQRLRDGKESRDDKALAGIEFESLGVDMLIVDEAHHFKNLGVPVASADLGMQLSSAAKCEDLLDKCEWLREARHGGNIAFMTGTPVSNSMSELYNMQRYLAPGTLKAQGLDTFAAWAGAYGQVVPTVELKPEGNGFQVKQRFARFQNLPELMNAVKQFTDMITNDDIQLPLPELEQVPVPVPITDRQKKEMEELSDRADRVRDGDVPPEVDNLLRITGDGRKIALDPKLLKGHENDRPLENGKIQACAENVVRIWQEETPRLGTQLVFCDSSTPASGGWNAYQDLKDRLIQLGVPAEQIAFVHDAGDNPARREQLFAKVRSGEIRVLMGSTQKLGTGTNVQERLAAIHDLDCPWRPADLEQRLGRIQRQGNTYDHVRDYRYVTKGTFDAYSYQTVERKQRFISQLMSSKSPAREAVDLDADVVTLANIKALATGDPDIQRRMTLENEINQLKLLRASWAQQKADTRRDINQQLQPRIEGIRQAIREKTDDKPLASKALSIHQTARMNGKWEGMTINGRPVGDRQTACRLLHQAAHQAHDGDTIAEYDGLPVIARRAATTGRITLAVKAVHEHESGTEMPGPYLTGPSSIVSQLDRIVKNMATDPGKLTERLADAERELAAAQETLAEPFAQEDEYRQKQAELERLTSKPDEPRETESRDQETKERSAGMPLTTENARRLLEQDHDVTEVTQGGNAMGHYLEARLTDGRAVQIDFHDNPAWKDTDRLAGRIEVSYANRPQAEWQYDDNDMADREHTVIDPADPAAEKTLAKAVEGWERAGGLHTARAAGTSHLAANQPPEEYAYRWRKPGDPDRHIAYLSTAFDRDQAMKAREDAGYVVTKVEEDPAILYEQHRKASCMRARHILERYDSPDPAAVGILHGIVGEVNAHDPENDIAAYLTYPSDKAVQLAGDGLTAADIAEKRKMGGWNPQTDPLMLINEQGDWTGVTQQQGDWTGVTQQQADQIVWDNREEILERASDDNELSTWTLSRLDQLKEHEPDHALDRDQPEPEHQAPAREQPAPRRHGLGL